MDHQTSLHRCRALVTELNTSAEWQLSPAAHERYVAWLDRQAGSGARSDAQLRTMLGYYHREHLLVEALADQGHPEHDRTWELIRAQVRRALSSRLASAQLVDHALSLDDLTQEALIDLVGGLRQFRYQSRFQTWMFAVIGHCLHRTLRAQGAQKRGEHVPAQSLELLEEAIGDATPALHVPGPESAVQLRLLAELLAQLLARHPDRRLGTIMQLWLVEDQPLRAIGEQLNLSVARVHTLLTQTLDLVRTDPAIQHWVAADSAGASIALGAQETNPP